MSETTADRLKRIHKTCVDLAVKASRAKADLFDRLEGQGLGMVWDDLVFHYFPRFCPPIKLKGIAV